MQAVIMAGGKGTRLVSLTNDEIPKPMALINNKPILEWQVEQLRANGITDIVICIGHLGEKIRSYFGNGSSWGVHIKYFQENQPMGSAGSLYFIREMLEDNAFFLIFGDVLFDINMKRMVEYHRCKKAEITLFVHPNSHPFDSDLVVMDSNGKVLYFDSKNNDRSSYWYENCVNAGLYVLEKSFCLRVCIPKKTDLEKNILIPMTEHGENIYAYSSPEYIKDVGTPERIIAAEKELKSGVIALRNLNKKQKAIFLDRDGTINVNKGLIWHESDFELYPFTAKAIGIINRSGYLAIVITNQPVVARGLCDIQDIEIIHKKFKTLLGREGVFIDDIKYCPHHPDRGFIGENPEYKIKCHCRKPDIGLIEECALKYNIDLKQSWFVGDTTTDVCTGKNAGMKTILVCTGEAGKDRKYLADPDIICKDLLEAIEVITEEK